MATMVRLLLEVGVPLLIGIAFYLAVVSYTAFFHYTAVNGHQLSIVATRGETISLHVNVEHSVAGHWASASGLQLQLNGVGSFLIVPPKDVDWSGTITTSGSSDVETVAIGGTFTLPFALAGTAHRVLDGVLSGVVDYPLRSDYVTPTPGDYSLPSPFNYENIALAVTIPIQIEVLPQDQAPWRAHEILLYATAVLGLLLLALLPRFLRFYDGRWRTSPYFNPVLVYEARKSRSILVNSGIRGQGYFVTLFWVCSLAAFFYGGGLAYPVIQLVGRDSGLYVAEVLSLMAALILTMLGSLAITGAVKGWRVKRDNS
jgi:hypothetical protein